MKKLKGYGDPRFYAILHEVAKLHSQKNYDYAKGSKQGHLGNFYRSSIIKRLYPGFDWTSPFGTAIDFMLKQLDAALLLYATNRKSVTGENIAVRLRDVTVYSVIAAILYSEECGEPLTKFVRTGSKRWKSKKSSR